jgi:Kef-type K+ transport system membrane component KefB
MNEILSVGLILLVALAAGHLVQWIRLPEVTGYLFVGVVIGPAAGDIITRENLEALELLSEVALGLILFSIGTIFDAATFRRVGRLVTVVTAVEAGAACVLVSIVMALLGMPAAVALLLGVVAMETAPATTLMVVREYHARGPMTEALLALLALNNVLVLLTFGVIAAVLTFVAGGGVSPYASVHGLLWSTLASAALGVLVGIGLDLWAARMRQTGEMTILAVGAVLLTVGAARTLGLSPLLATLAVGATIANTSGPTEPLVAELRRADPPLYAAFFVLAGAELPVGLLPQIGLAGTAYVIMRAIGKVGGAAAVLRIMSDAPALRRHLGWCILSSSSLAIGLTIQIRNQFPQFGEQVSAVVLAAVIVFEVIGPILARTALFRAGEAVETGPVLAPVDRHA